MRSRTLLFLFSIMLSTSVWAQAEWTWMIFLNGNNDLEEYADKTLTQLQPYATNPHIQVVVQFAKLSQSKTKRIHIKTNPNNPTEASPAVEELGIVDMGSVRSLIQFIDWTVEKYPAKHYLLTVWDHGTGWHGDPPSGKLLDELSHDDRSGNSISTEELGAATQYFAQKIGHKLDIFSTDACLMGAVEIAHEIAPYTDIYLGSEELEPVTGWPYHRILKQWATQSQITPIDLGKLITDQYVDYHIDGKEIEPDAVTYSVFDLRFSDPLTQALARLSKELLASDSATKFALKLEIKKVLVMADPDYADLGNLLDRFRAAPLSPKQVEAIEKVKVVYQQYVVHNRFTTEWKDATGATIWFPKTHPEFSPFSNLYKKLRFGKETQWVELIKMLLVG